MPLKRYSKSSLIYHASQKHQEVLGCSSYRTHSSPSANLEILREFPTKALAKAEIVKMREQLPLDTWLLCPVQAAAVAAPAQIPYPPAIDQNPNDLAAGDEFATDSSSDSEPRGRKHGAVGGRSRGRGRGRGRGRSPSDSDD